MKMWNWKCNHYFNYFICTLMRLSWLSYSQEGLSVPKGWFYLSGQNRINLFGFIYLDDWACIQTTLCIFTVLRVQVWKPRAKTRSYIKMQRRHFCEQSTKIQIKTGRRKKNCGKLRQSLGETSCSMCKNVNERMKNRLVCERRLRSGESRGRRVGVAASEVRAECTMGT